MGKLLDVGFVDRLGEKFFGKGNRYFLSSDPQWAASPKGSGAPNVINTSDKYKAKGGYGRSKEDSENFLGVYHILQNALYTQTKEYVGIMMELAENIYNSYGIEPQYQSDEPIPDNFFYDMIHHGNVIVATFGNHSGHARYVEWGTGPKGKNNQSKITEAMTRKDEKINYRDTPWVYWNDKVGHYVRTDGMAPRPFVHPAFLRLRSPYINSLKMVCKYLNNYKWDAGMYPDHRGARGKNEGKGGRHGLG